MLDEAEIIECSYKLCGDENLAMLTAMQSCNFYEWSFLLTDSTHQI